LVQREVTVVRVKDLERVLYHEPFQPFRLVLSDGEEVTVSVPRKAHVSGEYVALSGLSRYRDGTTRQGLRIFRVDEVASVESVTS